MTNKLSQNTIPKFLWSAIKPYKWWYLLMMQAPFSNAVYPLIYNYAIKLLIDLFTQNVQITAVMAFWPVFLFIFANVLLETCWRIHNFAAWRSMPYIMQDVMNKVYDYVSNHSYQFFQNNLTGTIISKVKGINDGCQRKKFPGYFLSYKNNLKNLRFLIKKMEKILIKNKIKKLTFFEKNCFQIFYHGLKALIIEAFSTPHGSRCPTQLQSFAPLR